MAESTIYEKILTTQGIISLCVFFHVLLDFIFKYAIIETTYDRRKREEI